jgi:hypothetical protein
MAKLVLLALFCIAAAVPQAQWYTQKLDHFTPDPRDWQQKYYVNDTFWGGPGYPIFVYIGGEGPQGPGAIVRSTMAKIYAPKYEALMFALEHRFYGESQPLPDWTTESLAYLSSQQALSDLAEFILAMKTKYNAENSTVITFGGSYPGNLAAWFRMKFPSVTYASVASSAPVQAELDFFQYLDVVDKSLSFFAGEACDKQISIANQQLSQLLSTPEGTQKVETLFNTCQPFDGPNDIANFASILMGNFMGTVQYDNEAPTGPTIVTLCQLMEAKSDALQAYVDVSNYFLSVNDQSCLDVSYADSMVGILNTTVDFQNNMRQWTYQTCNEFGYFQTTDDSAVNQPFGSFVNLEFYTQQCQQAFNIDGLPHIDFTNAYYGGNNPQECSNIFFVNGSLDPWHALSVLNSTLPGISTILINGTAHCADMGPPTVRDPPSLAIAQAVISAQIGTWLSDAQQSK